MPLPAAEALQQVEITVLRQIGDNVAAQTRALEGQAARIEKLGEKMDDVRERVIRLEEQKVAKEVEDVKVLLGRAMDRIDQLESQRDKNAGATSVWTWLSKNAPWLFAGIAAFAAGLGLKGLPHG